MKSVYFSLAVVLALAGCALTYVGSAAAKPATRTPATSTVADRDASGIPFRIGSDSLGAYHDAVNSVLSDIQAFGDWELDMKSSTLRKSRVDLGDPVIDSNPNPPFQAAVLAVRFISKCTDSNVFMPGLAVGQMVTCPLSLNFDYNGVNYALRSNVLHPGTEPVQWTCLARSSTNCVSFEAVPSVIQADGQRKIKMQLVQTATRKVAEQSLGFFYMSFDIHATTP